MRHFIDHHSSDRYAVLTLDLASTGARGPGHVRPPKPGVGADGSPSRKAPNCVVIVYIFGDDYSINGAFYQGDRDVFDVFMINLGFLLTFRNYYQSKKT